MSRTLGLKGLRVEAISNKLEHSIINYIYMYVNNIISNLQ